MKTLNFENTDKGSETQEIFKANPKFKDDAREISTTIGLTKKLYALGLVEINQEGEYKGHANDTKINFWHDYATVINYGDLLRQIELHLENKIDAYTGGRTEANYDFARDHYIIYETKTHDLNSETDKLHTDEARSKYLYEAGKENGEEIEVHNQANELLESLRLPLGPTTKHYYLRAARECPLEELGEAFDGLQSIHSEINKVDLTQSRTLSEFIKSNSYMALTEAADLLDRNESDFVRLPNGHIIVLNEEALVNPKEIADKELAEFEDKRLNEMYNKYLLQDKSSTVRGSKDDLEQFKAFLQSL